MLYDFEYYTPTKVIFGNGVEKNIGRLIKEQKATKVLIHYGSHFAKKSGLIDRIKAILKESGIDSVELGGVVPNPRLSLVHKGIKLCKEENVDFILAVGGGSTIDSSKGIGFGLADEEQKEVWDFYERKRTPKACTPIGVILTIAAAGSEMSSGSVITNEDGFWKKSASSEKARPKFAIMNPALTFSLPKYQTMSGCVDIMMHTLERYFTHVGSQMTVTDQIAEGVLRTVKENALILNRTPDNYNARANVMWASSLSHNGLTACGNSCRGDWACHDMEHEIGGLFDVAHGAGLAALWSTWARYVYEENPARFAQLGYTVFALPYSGNIKIDALSAIDAMEDFFTSISMPINLKELGISPTEAQLKEMAKKGTAGNTKTLGDMKKLNEVDLYNIYKGALGK